MHLYCQIVHPDALCLTFSIAVPPPNCTLQRDMKKTRQLLPGPCLRHFVFRLKISTSSHSLEMVVHLLVWNQIKETIGWSLTCNLPLSHTDIHNSLNSRSCFPGLLSFDQNFAVLLGKHTWIGWECPGLITRSALCLCLVFLCFLFAFFTTCGGQAGCWRWSTWAGKTSIS